ncbi:MAG: hypothetical protein O7F15_10355, partial [Gammaproteobacteria bacterium]|nr:hypothetical protein [Gammaproteobacteria bacterium]
VGPPVSSKLLAFSDPGSRLGGRDDANSGLKAVPFVTEGLFIDHFQILKKICAISHICKA